MNVVLWVDTIFVTIAIQHDKEKLIMLDVAQAQYILYDITMREIKFRAWDTLNHKMYYDMVDFRASGIGVKVIGTLEDSEFEDWSYVYMQYTGLKDKNGKEIYEGDILRSGHTDSIEGVVKYQAPEFIVQLPRRRTWTAFILTPEQNQFQEIAGNIYENKDLLK